MKKAIVAILMMLVLLLPMYAGIARIRRLPRRRDDQQPPAD